MTEPGVASSDATNMEATAVVDGDEVVINGRKWWSSGDRPPRLQGPDLHGPLRPRRRPPPPAHDGAGPARHPRCEGRAAAVHDERVRRADRPRRGQLRRRARAEGEHPARRGTCLRDRPGTARPGPGAPLHAADRPGRGRPRAGHQARPVAYGVRQADRQPRRQPRAHRRRPDRHRPGPAARAQRGVEARRRWPAQRAQRGQPDQGDRPEHGPAGDRHGDAAARRRRPLR